MFVFTKQAQKQFRKLDNRIQNQIREKLLILKQDLQLLSKNIKPLADMNPISHRLRIGSYRLLLSFDNAAQTYIVLKIAHRKNVYK